MEFPSATPAPTAPVAEMAPLPAPRTPAPPAAATAPPLEPAFEALAVEIDWSDVDVSEAPAIGFEPTQQATSAPTAPPSPPPAEELPHAVPIAELEAVDFSEPPRRPLPEPIELLEGDVDEAIELVPSIEFIPKATESGSPAARSAAPIPLPSPLPASRDEGLLGALTPAPSARAADGGEAHLRDALSRASREVVERIAWEVVPQLAETIIREQLDRLVKDRQR